jgi:hypothetical protein
MKIDLRYNLQHIGDIFVDVVQKTADTAIQCSSSIFLTYDINMLSQKRKQVLRDIGERVTQLINEGSTDLMQCAKLSELVAQLNSIENKMAEHEKARCNPINPFRSNKAACECTNNGK